MANTPLSGKKHFELSDQQRLDWLRLIRSQNVGPATFRDLISRYGTATAALDALPDLAKRGGAAGRIKICSIADAERELLKAEAAGALFIGIGEPHYPPVLRVADASPPLICLRGNVDILSRKSLAVVGSRNASITGMKLAQRLSTHVAENGYAIVSGLARGIDSIAHKASLKTGTIAVFGGGVDFVFPEENQLLAEEILENGGAIVSEMPMGWQPRSRDFPRRNRIISGLAQAVLVVEAARRSGSLITARLANEMGRLVLAVPGSPLDPRSEGTNKLIRSGATLITCGDDILEDLSPLFERVIDPDEGLFETDEDLFGSDLSSETPPTGDKRQVILSKLGPSPVLIDDIIEFSGASAGEVQLTLLELSLAGFLERHPGGLVSLVGEPEV